MQLLRLFLSTVANERLAQAATHFLPYKTAVAASSSGHSQDGTQRITATGLHGAANTVVYCPPTGAAAPCGHVCVFAGDLQAERNIMSASRKASEWGAYCLEATATNLARHKFPGHHVWVIKPSRHAHGAFACYENFSSHTCRHSGAFTWYDPHGFASLHLELLLQSAFSHVGLDSGRLPDPTLPITLVGFSKGGGALNQLVTELGADTAARRLFSRVAAVHWVDAGNGMHRGSLPADAAALAALAAEHPSVRLRVHGSPYQWRNADRPWLALERDAFVRAVGAARAHAGSSGGSAATGAGGGGGAAGESGDGGTGSSGGGEQGSGAPVRCTEYFGDMPGSLALHFRMLEVFDPNGA
ncbi:hypothetical protein JKP88DRAFT_205417 [Tribonema minus]|uniref:Uncharacterized protein n=1 Tax=Tribonema minus TaxID=303371 RepID=A0A835ZEC5_9STRA|nr:hypothetical protein JKP88DRAFT_205417 [Tribonema minus]